MWRLEEFSIAQRMSWAAYRTTTRVEDIAYCPLGIFNVNMPLLGGEGTKAFVRLQEAIIQQSDDKSIFAWTGVHKDGDGLLASHPSAFALGRHIVQRSSRSAKSPFSITNRGLAISCMLFPIELNTYFVPIECELQCPQPRFRRTRECTFGIYLCRTRVDDQYRRVTVQEYDLGVMVGTPENRRVISNESDVKISRRRGHCPPLCTSRHVLRHTDKMLYVPQDYRIKLPIRGTIRIHIGDRGIQDMDAVSSKTLSKYNFRDIIHLSLISLSNAEASGLLSKPATNARMSNISDDIGGMLSIDPDELDDGICVCVPGYGSSVRFIRMGFDLYFRPSSVVVLRTRIDEMRRKGNNANKFHNLENSFLDFAANLDEGKDVKVIDGALVIVGDRLNGIKKTVKLFTDELRQQDVRLFISLEPYEPYHPTWRLYIREERSETSADADPTYYDRFRDAELSEDDL